MWAEQRQETLPFQWKTVTPSFFAECNSSQARKAFEQPEQCDANLRTRRSPRKGAVQMAPGMVCYYLIQQCPQLWAVGRTETQPQCGIVCPMGTHNGDVLILGHWAQLGKGGLLWGAGGNESTRPSELLSSAPSPWIQGSWGAAVALYSIRDWRGCQQWGLGVKVKNVSKSVCTMIFSKDIITSQ